MTLLYRTVNFGFRFGNKERGKDEYRLPPAEEACCPDHNEDEPSQ